MSRRKPSGLSIFAGRRGRGPAFSRRDENGDGRGTGGLNRPYRIAGILAAAIAMPLFPAVALAATEARHAAVGVGIASLGLMGMFILVAAMWRHFARASAQSSRPRWQDWG